MDGCKLYILNKNKDSAEPFRMRGLAELLGEVNKNYLSNRHIINSKSSISSQNNIGSILREN